MKNDVGVRNHPTIDERVQELRRRSDEQIFPLGVAPIPPGPSLFEQPKSGAWDWLVLRLMEDPLYLQGELNIPQDVQRRLVALDKAGVEFDDLWIAHEVPKGSQLGPAKSKDGLKQMLAPQRTSPQAQRLKGLFNVLAAGAVAAVTLPMFALASVANADPVLLGVLTSTGSTEPGTLAAYFFIARW
jgi:hypothetical protein